MSAERQVLLVTGAASGVGLAAVRAAHADGQSVIAFDIDGPGLKRLAGELDDILVYEVDVTDESRVAEALADAMGRLGRLDGCFNNAGIGTSLLPVTDVDVEELSRVLRINAVGSFTVLKHVMRQMRSQGYGAVVNTGSILGYRGVVNYAAYCASKSAVHAFTKVAALEGAEYGVRVNAVAPGLIDTPMNDAFHEAVSPQDPVAAQRALEAKIPLHRYATAQEVVDVALALLRADMRYVTGSIVEVDGGLSTSF